MWDSGEAVRLSLLMVRSSEAGVGGEGWGSGLSRVRLLRGFSKEDPHNNRRVDSGQERRRGT